MTPVHIDTAQPLALNLDVSSWETSLITAPRSPDWISCPPAPPTCAPRKPVATPPHPHIRTLITLTCRCKLPQGLGPQLFSLFPSRAPDNVPPNIG